MNRIWKRVVISFGKAQTFFEAGVDSSVLDCFKKSEATPPNGINQRFPRSSTLNSLPLPSEKPLGCGSEVFGKVWAGGLFAKQAGAGCFS